MRDDALFIRRLFFYRFFISARSLEVNQTNVACDAAL